MRVHANCFDAVRSVKDTGANSEFSREAHFSRKERGEDGGTRVGGY